MKYLLLAIVSISLLQAETHTMTPREHSSIHDTHGNAVKKMRKKSKMHRIHKVNEEEAAKLIKEETGEEVVSMKLTHRGSYLLYKARTKNYSIELNAMNAEIMKKSKRD